MCKLNGISPLHTLINLYETIVVIGDSSCAKGHLPEQNYSHAYLAKMIGAALAFERYRIEMKASYF